MNIHQCISKNERFREHSPYLRYNGFREYMACQ